MTASFRYLSYPIKNKTKESHAKRIVENKPEKCLNHTISNVPRVVNEEIKRYVKTKETNNIDLILLAHSLTEENRMSNAKKKEKKKNQEYIFSMTYVVPAILVLI